MPRYKTPKTTVLAKTEPGSYAITVGNQRMYHPVHGKQLEGRSEYSLIRGARPVPTMTEAALDEKCRNDPTWEETRKNFDGIAVVGLKPAPGDPYVHVVPFPGTSWAIRFWPGGWDDMDRCCFDFLLHGVATNNPESWKISYALSQSVLGPKGDKIISLEKALRCRKIPPGEERFVVKQGTSCHINFGDGADGVVVTAPLYDEIPAVAAVPASGPKLFTV